MTRLRVIVACFSIFTVSIGLPTSAEAAAWFSGFHKITQILLHDDSLEVMLEGNSECSRVFRLGVSEKNYSVKASALLSAYYAGHRLGLYYSGDLSSCSTPLHRFKVRP